MGSGPQCAKSLHVTSLDVEVSTSTCGALPAQAQICFEANSAQKDSLCLP